LPALGTSLYPGSTVFGSVEGKKKREGWAGEKAPLPKPLTNHYEL